MPDTKKLENDHVIDYFDQLGLDVRKLLKKKLAQVDRTKEAQLPKIDIPDIEKKDAPMPKSDVATKKDNKPPTKPTLDPTDTEIKLDQEETEEAISGLDSIIDQLSEIELQEKLEATKQEIMRQFDHKIKSLQEEVTNLKERKIPEIQTIDSGGMYKEKIFDIVTRVLDEVLVHLIEDIPDYSLIAVQVSRTFEDGTVSDAIVSIMVTVPNNGYRYEFKVDVPILNGLIHYPTFIQRGQKIIPLTKEKIQEELDSLSFRKLDSEYMGEKSNLYNNIGDNIHRRPDRQKWYDVYSTEPKSSTVPFNSRWNTRKDNRSYGR